METENSEHSREELQEMVKNAVAEKENVIMPFRGVKKGAVAEKKYGFKYLLWNFLGGLAFGLGLLLMILLAAWLLSNFNEVRTVLGTFGKLVSMLKALGK